MHPSEKYLTLNKDAWKIVNEKFAKLKKDNGQSYESIGGYARELDRRTVSNFVNRRKAVTQQNFILLCEYFQIDWTTAYEVDNSTEQENNVLTQKEDFEFNPMLYSEHTQGFKDIFKQKLENFVGRRYVFDEFNEIILNNLGGYYILRGDPGEGKSAIIAKYASEHKCLFYLALLD